MRKILVFILFLFHTNTYAQVSLYGNFSFAKPIFSTARNTNNKALVLPFLFGVSYQIPDKKWHFGGEFGVFGLGRLSQNIGFANATTGSDAIFWRLNMQYDFLEKAKKLIPYANMGVGIAYFSTQLNVENPLNTDEDLFVKYILDDKSYMINHGVGVRWHLVDFSEEGRHSFWLDFRLSHTFVPNISYINPLAEISNSYTGTGMLKEITVTNPQTNLSRNVVVGRQYKSDWQYWATSLGVIFQF